MPKIAAPVQRFLVQRGDHVKAGPAAGRAGEPRSDGRRGGEQGAGRAGGGQFARHHIGARFPNAVVKAQTDVDTAKQTEDAAKKVLDNREKLFQQGALARKLVDEAQVAYAQAHGALLSAQEHLRALQSCRQAGTDQDARPRRWKPRAATCNRRRRRSAIRRSSARSPAWSPIARCTPARWPRPARRWSR